MLQAYNKMRGPVPDDSPEDPLFEWIHLREDMSSKEGKLPPSRNKRDILRMLRKVDETLSEGNAAGDSPREAVFEINRPGKADHHIRAPPGHDFSTHVLTACCADFEFESDDSDDEETNRAAVPRPPEFVDTPPMPPRPFRYPGWDIERQVDQSTGYDISPCYAVPTSPSLLYEPEGIDAVRAHDPTSFAGRYSRMDPEAGKALRKLVLYYRPNTPIGSGYSDSGSSTPGPSMVDDGDEEYSHSKIEALLMSPTVRPPHTRAPGLPIAPHLDQHLGKAYATLADHEAQAEEITQNLRRQTARIWDLQEEREHLSAAVGIIQSRQQQQQWTPRATMIRSPEEKKREKRISRHLATHIEDVQYKSIQAADTLGHERMTQETNDAAIARLETDIAELCYEAGLDSPAEVYDELAGRNVPDNAATRLSSHHHHHLGNIVQGQGQDVQEGGAIHAPFGKDNARDVTFPTMPLQPIITTITPRRKSTQTPRQQPSSPTPAPASAFASSPAIQSGAFSSPREQHTPQNGGEFEDEIEGEDKFDEAEYLAVERVLESTEAYLERLQKKH
ncbi:hypothetical protein PG996_003570 [Apiospora saccharicola]|uniref:Uncharacterized protein n=1 Tax=Apiospora saccharicola TaxID=335842 RepID=A0ABR1W1M6_9PEZI